MGWQDAPVASDYPATGAPPTDPSWKIPPEVRAERDRTRLALLNKETGTYTDQESQAALSKEIAQTEKKVGAPKWKDAPIAESGPPANTATDFFSAKPTYRGSENIGTEATRGEYIANRAKVGLAAGTIGMPGDIAALTPSIKDDPTRLLEVISSPRELALQILHAGQEAISTPGEPKVGTSEWYAKNLLGYKPDLKAPDETSRYLGKAAEFGAGGVTSLARKAPLEVAKAAGFLTGVSATAAGTSELGEKVAGPTGGMIGGLLAVPAFSYLAKLPSVATAIKSMFSSDTRQNAMQGVEDFLKPLVAAKAERDLATGLTEQGAEKSVANITEAADVQAKINQALAGTGQQVTTTAGQASGADRVINAELNARKSSFAANAVAKASSESNAAAILSYIKQSDNPPLATNIKKAVDNVNQQFNDTLEGYRKDAEAIQKRAQTVPDVLSVEATPEERGIKLGEIARTEKAAEDIVKNKIYDAVRVQAEKDNAVFDQSLIKERASSLLDNPILRYDATNAPTVVGVIDRLLKPKVAEAPGLPPIEGLTMSPENVAKKGLSYQDIQAMETAVNQDIAAELAAATPNTRQRLRALGSLKEAIQGTVTGSDYPEVSRLYSAASDYYRDTYSPRFNVGINAKLWMRDNFGDNKVLDENVLDQYMRNQNNMNRFTALFGKNPDALNVMQEHVFDRFRGAVVKDGVIDPVRYQKFVRDSSEALAVLEKAGLPAMGKLDNLNTMTQRFSDRAATLAQQEKELATDKLTQALKTKDIDLITKEAMGNAQTMSRLTNSLGEEGSQALASKVMRELQEKITFPPESGKVGLDTKAMSDFLNNNDTTLRILFRKAYGPQEGAAHLDRLETAYKMMAIQDRVGLPPANEVSGVGVDPLKAATNVSLASLWSMARAVFRGVNSPENMAIVLGGQAASGVMQKAYNNLIQSIATDPESSKRLLKLVQTGGPAAPTKGEMVERAKAMAGMMGNLGYFWVGGKYYGPSMQALAPGTVAMMEEQKRRQEMQNAATQRP